MIKSSLITLLFIICSVFILSAQTLKDESMLVPMVSVNIGYNHPGGDFAKRFDGSGQVGSSFKLKLKNNLLIGVEGSYLFSQGVKDREYFKYLMNEEAWITNIYGDPGLVSESLSGFMAYGQLGYIFNVFAKNPNSGIMVTGGLGLMQHKIDIEQRGNNLPQLTDEYIKGYDRLCNGLMTNQFIGYIYFHDKGIWNFFAGMEFTQGFTQNRRDWDFIEERKINDKRTDLLYSFKFGWVLSLHKRMATEIYYY